MNVKDVGLILEGGGMRGAYTAGVLDYFLEKNISFSSVYGASAGACTGSSFVSSQQGRNYKVIVEYGDHPEYISFKRAIRKGELFGMDFIFDTLPNSLVPFDFDRFCESSSKFVVSTTDIDTGEPVYINEFSDRDELLTVIRASSSLPLLAPSIPFQGRNLMDGGIADPVPIRPSIDAGNKKHVIVLTRNRGYIKRKTRFGWLFKRRFKEYPNLIHALEVRHERYNQTMEKIEEMEKNKEALVIRPEKPLKVSRVENKKEKLHDLYLQGVQEASAMHDKIVEFIDL